MGRPLNVLLVEDSEDDATLMIRELERGGYDVTCKRVETSSAMERALDKRKWDVVIADHNLPDFSAPAALTVLQNKGLDLPFIIVSGVIREDVAVEAMKAGAHDYIAKGNMARLVPAVGRELREASGRQQRSHAEDKLRKLSRAVEHSPAVVIITDTKGNIEYVNPKFTQVTGYTSEEAIGQNPHILKSGKTPPGVYKELWETISSGGEWHGEFCNKKRNGELYWEDVSISPVRDPDGVITNFVAVKEDITGRKRTEEELKKLTESLEHRVVERTEELQRMLHELGSQQEVLETRNLELQELQQVLEESRNRYADLYDFSPVGYITLDGKGYIREINLTGVGLLDREMSELVDSRFANFVDKDSTEVFKKHLRRCGDSSDEVTTEMALKAKGGTIWVHLLSIPFHDKARQATQATMYRTAITDITGRKRMEEEMRGLTKSLEQRVAERTAELKKTNKELKTRIAEREKAEEDMKKSHNLLSSVVEGTTDAVFVKDLEGRILMINSAGAGIFGGAVEEVTGKDNSELFPSDIAREMTKHDRIVMDSGETEVFEEAAIINGATCTFLSTKGPYRDSKGNVIGVIGIARDITGRKQAEEELRQSREGLARAQQIAHLGSWEWDVVRDESRCSDETCRILGMKPPGIFSHEVFLNCVHPDDREFVKKSVDAALDKKRPYSMDYRVVHPEGTERTVHTEGEVVYDETGRPLRMVGTVQDITDRKRAEEALRKSEERYRVLARVSPVGIWHSDPDGNCLYVNERCSEIIGLCVEEALREGWARNLHPEDRERVYSEWYRAAKDNSPFKSEYRFVRPDGVTTWVLGEATAEVSKTGEVMGYVGTITDITDRKRAEELTRASLKEKEELLNEVHHRVKNNLQIISSLLDMRSMRTSNQEAIDLFTDARSKINAMSLIHSALYRSDRFDRICLEEHTRKLVEFLLYIYAKGKDVTFDIKRSDVHLPVSQAIPCALVLNELVSNALKHGYREGQKGAIEISINRLPEEAVSIRVKDDGAGIPAEIDIFNVDSLGLKLVRNLVQKQLSGKIRVERNGGTEFTIEFPLLHKDVGKEGVRNA